MNLQEAQAFFAQDHYAAQATGIRILSAGGEDTRCALQVEERHQNAHGFLMGGVYFTLADYTFAVATNTPEENVMAISANISFLQPPADKELTSSARCLHQGGRTCVWIISLWDGQGNQTASVTFTGYRKKRLPKEEPPCKTE